MVAFADVEDFVRRANRINQRDELADHLFDISSTLGFDHVALINRNRNAPGAVHYGGYPDNWVEVAIKRNYFANDPVSAACENTAAAFVWSDLPRIMPLSQQQIDVMADSAANGIAEGFTVPLNVPGDLPGACNFVVRTGRELPKTLPAAQYVACFAFEAARRIRMAELAKAKAAGGMAAIERPRLTTRQLDCLVLAAQGKSDWHIAQLLGISNDTVHQHIETAKRRYNVASRTQLVVRALYDQQITFADTM